MSSNVVNFKSQEKIDELSEQDDLDEISEELAALAAKVNQAKKDKYNAYRNKWRDQNREKVNSQARGYYNKDRSKAVERVKKYNKLYAKERSEYNKKYTEENYEKIIEKNKLWKRRNPVKVKVYDIKKHLKRKYKITLDQYLEMAQKQDGKCAICGNASHSNKVNLGVDHCHATGKVRALLCVPCNAGLGNFKENLETMLKAMEYLKFHREG